MVRTRGGCELPRSCVLRQAVRIKLCAGLCVHRRGIACGMLANLHTWCPAVQYTAVLPAMAEGIRENVHPHAFIARQGFADLITHVRAPQAVRVEVLWLFSRSSGSDVAGGMTLTDREGQGGDSTGQNCARTEAGADG